MDGAAAQTAVIFKPFEAMIAPKPPVLISCDESGFTGPRLLDRAQPMFAYAAHDLTPAEAEALIEMLRAPRMARPLSKVELKAGTLRARPDWPDIVAAVFETVGDRFIATVMDKRLALAGKVFEYLVEPVIADNSMLFYRSDIQRFVAAEIHFAIRDGAHEPVADALSSYMRSFDPADAPLVFDVAPELPREAAVLREVLRFARGYKAKIVGENAHLQSPSDYGKWTLDLTATALHTLLVDGFGKRHARIEALCDESGPLRAMNDFFDSFVDRDEIIPIEAGVHAVTWKLNLAKPIELGSSKDHPTLQIADILAGAAADILGPKPAPGLAALKPELVRRLHPFSILPEQRTLEPDDPRRLFYMDILRELAARAALRKDPLAGMAGVFERANKRRMSPAGRARRRAGTRAGP